MNLKEFITKLQNLPDKQKKIVLWTIVVILGLIMGAFWFNSAVKRFSKLGDVIPEIKLPEIEVPTTETQTNETAGWKTYTNEEYGFEIKYPKDWTDCNVSGNFLLSIIPPVNISRIPDGMSYEVFRGYSCGFGSFQIRREEKKYTKFSDAKNYYWSLYKENECEPELMIKETIFQGQPALQMESCDPSGEYSGTSIFLIYSQKAFNISFSDGISKEITNQILSTFKFTK